MREIALALAGGLVSGGLFVALAAGSFGGIMFAYLSEVPLFLVGLGLGFQALLIAGAFALLIVGIGGGVPTAGLFAAFGLAPILILMRQALLNRPTPGGIFWYPPGLLIGWLTAIGATGILVTGLLLSGHAEGAEAAVQQMLGGALRMMTSPESMPAESIDQLAEGFAAIFLGVTALSWMLMMAVNGSLAQGVLVGFGKNIRPSPDISELEIPRWIYYAFVVAILIAVAAGGTLGYIARNLAITFAAAFFFQGLATIHALVRSWSARSVSLIVFYLVLIVFGWPAVIVTVLGLAEPFLRLRARFGGPDRGKEE